MIDNPGKYSLSAFRRSTDEDIRHSGRSIIFGVSCEENGPLFAYTIGNHLKGLPELLIIGTIQGACLNDLSQMMIKSGKPFLDGQLVRINAGRLPVKIIRANNTAEACLRKIQFEWMTSAAFPARVRSIFARGHYFEIESRQQLLEAGFVFAPVEALGFVVAEGLIAGHADGIILAVPDDVKLALPALWECKGLNAKNYRAVERDGLAKVFPRYAAQVAIYQHFLGVLNPALMTIVNADTCERLHFTVAFDARLMQETIDRATDVINATRAGELLPRFDQACEDFRCRMCSHREVPAL